MEKTNKPSIEDIVERNVKFLGRSAGRVTYSGSRHGSAYAIVSRETGEILFVDSTVTPRDDLGENPIINLSYPLPGREGQVGYYLAEKGISLTPLAQEALDRTFEEYNHPSH